MSHDNSYVLKAPVQAYRLGEIDSGILSSIVGKDAHFMGYGGISEFDGSIIIDGTEEEIDVNLSDMIVLFGDGDWDVYSDIEFNSLFTQAPTHWDGFVGD